MANCCGGKNAGKPVSTRRYLAGLGVFVGYHGAMRVMLEAASLPFPALRKVRDFHKEVFETELKEVLALEDINLNGRLGATRDEALGQVCAVDFEDAISTVEVEDGVVSLGVPTLHTGPKFQATPSS